jgi:hypothetical protein
MSFENFKPTLWSTRYINNTDKRLVFSQVVDTSWDIVGGKAMKINEIGDVSVTDYTSTGVTFQDIPDAQKEFPIDQKKKFAFQIKDVDKAQMNVGLMDGSMKKAAFSMGDTIDSYIAGKYLEAGITNATNLGSATTGLNLYANMMPDLITYMQRYLKEANAHERPWCVAPPWFMQLIGYGMYTYGAKQFDTPGAVNDAPLSGAFPFMGFDFYESNNVSNDGTDYRIMFGTRDAIGFKMQLEEIEAVRLENYFSDGIKGLSMYGSKVIRPDHLGVVHAQFSGLTT